MAARQTALTALDAGGLVARKPFRYEGRQLEPGELLDPQPSGVLRTRLVDHRFVVHESAGTESYTRPGFEAKNDEAEVRARLAAQKAARSTTRRNPAHISPALVRS